ncbi:FUSC family protein [Xanthobacter versatilis]|uniref:FUSC family protein n=1 Tax=Xanthobacter autotrophicus (strain ATCC BAA-1158 / Py2) TaxID=78245 RepID=UPI00372762D1
MTGKIGDGVGADVAGRDVDAVPAPPGWVATLRRAARWMELRSFGLTPEHFTLAEGLRAALAVAVPLALVLASGRYQYGWAIFGAYWSCLCDTPGPHRLRRALLALFVILGTPVAFLGSWLASFGTVAALVAAPLIVVLSALLPVRLAHAGLLSALVGGVGVVAVGFPHPAAQAGELALSFMAGSCWAYLLVNVLWRVDAWRPARQMSVAVFTRLGDMLADMVATGDGPHRDGAWHPAHSEHRRAVRFALERLRALIARYEREPEADLRPFLLLQEAAEQLFSAAIALEHDFILREGPARERMAAADAMLEAVLACRATVAEGPRGGDILARQVDALGQLRATLPEGLAAGCLLATQQAVGLVAAAQTGAAVASLLPPVVGDGRIRWQDALKQGVRQAAAVVVVLYVAIVFQFGYPYWATMAVVMVMQGAARVAWTRGLERIFGSLLGGLAALCLLLVSDAPPTLAGVAVLLAGVSIALRSVNYAVFVVFLTMLFIIVTELVQPGAGIGSARILDNTVGSLTAVLAVLLLWPDFGPPVTRLIADGLNTNRAYIDAVRAGRDEGTIAAARRAAGLSSIAAEVALHALGGLLRRWQRLSHEDAAALRELRMLAGEAAAAWHRRLAAGDRQDA